VWKRVHRAHIRSMLARGRFAESLREYRNVYWPICVRERRRTTENSKEKKKKQTASNTGSQHTDIPAYIQYEEDMELVYKQFLMHAHALNVNKTERQRASKERKRVLLFAEDIVTRIAKRVYCFDCNRPYRYVNTDAHSHTHIPLSPSLYLPFMPALFSVKFCLSEQLFCEREYVKSMRVCESVRVLLKLCVYLDPVFKAQLHLHMARVKWALFLKRGVLRRYACVYTYVCMYVCMCSFCNYES